MLDIDVEKARGDRAGIAHAAGEGEMPFIKMP